MVNAKYGYSYVLRWCVLNLVMNFCEYSLSECSMLDELPISLLYSVTIVYPRNMSVVENIILIWSARVFHKTKRSGISNMLRLVIIICGVQCYIAFLNLFSYCIKLNGNNFLCLITFNLICLYQFVAESYNTTIVAGNVFQLTEYCFYRVAKSLYLSF